ncbi:acyltransferase family protein [Butyrivibrio sp. AD3002]|uniref:acyltransferase family protein n=1 Tax=Butyrivibrio sp. AD3002 TaxID=1280670 RepID=UPI0003B47B37|nr:acyltransferase [Butyrivibrio sp. AD3002]
MKLEYKYISKYRKELMGIAIMLIVISHNNLDFPWVFHNVNSGIKMLCQVGVDIFFLLSGFGCYYSMKKDSNPISFYRKRIMRLVPPYLTVFLIFGLYAICVMGKPFNEYLWTYSLISFYVDNTLNEWFVASIILVYLIYPLIYVIVEKSEAVAKALLILIYAIIVLFLCHIIRIPNPIRIVFEILGTRFPAFLIGSLMAKNSEGSRGIKLSTARYIIILGVLSSILSLYVFKMKVANNWIIIRTVFIFIVFSIIICWIIVRDKAENNNIIRRCTTFFTFVGGITLEIYLVHEKVLGILTPVMYGILPLSSYSVQLVIYIIGTILSIFLASYLGKFIKKMQRK